ncbi:MAG: methyl-accepting chemotaxis protein [Rhodocyclales bacterium]|nr:methyl-accepting chemotaxis protein [Rhodocyclales bacterium]
MMGRISIRLYAGFGAVIVLFLGALGFAMKTSFDNTAELDRISADNLRAAVGLANAQNAMWQLRYGVAEFMVRDADGQAKIVADEPKWAATMEESLAAYAKGERTDEEKAGLAELSEVFRKYAEARPRWFDLYRSGKTSEAAEWRAKTIFATGGATVKALTRQIELQKKVAAERAEQVAASAGRARTIMIGLAVLAFLLASGVSLWITRSVMRPLGGEPAEANAVVEKIAQGDLSAPIPVRPGDSDSLLAHMKRMQESLRDMVTGLKSSADSVAGSAQQLAISSEQVAQATGRQSEAASSMAASVEQMTVSVNHVSDSAAEARRLTGEAGDLSEAGSQTIQNTVTEMKGISETVGQAARTIQAMGENSHRMSGIVQVIRDVAEQTNLLALNAAIEAARAGEQGRGFAVVADEVRKLAERTAAATTEIGGMINTVQEDSKAAVATMEQAVTRVENGVNMASRAGDSMHSIREGTDRVVMTVNEISGALKEQSAAANSIAASVEEVAQMSEETNAAMREAAGTARELERLAENVRGAVGKFRV